MLSRHANDLADLPLGETARPARTSHDVYDRLRLAIVTGEIRPNAPLIEADLAGALNVSRTPIRESLQRLSADGLIVPRKRGWAVREYSREEIQESYEVRAALEGYAAFLAAARGTDAELAAIAAVQAERDRAASPGREFRVRTNRAFHDGIIAAARNARLTEAIFRAGQFYFNARIAAMTTEEDFRSNQADHGRIVRALLARDASAAEQAMRAHILHTFTVFQRLGPL
ncbi:MAG: GntR family transcriptional regulator [Rhodospirillales bacterium]|nr:GntR family transcriptional regulator [Rhodospirillales bacterium]MDE2199496.1 GntR family transcriptional regulator [Rhodospirillales bacterium]MDE2575790.1 GntR family transcriptional regulator [Rhodospirillales bacterium]